ncbi:MAG: hypothetical protein RR838_07270 [Clostridium sp.]
MNKLNKAYLIKISIFIIIGLDIIISTLNSKYNIIIIDDNITLVTRFILIILSSMYVYYIKCNTYRGLTITFILILIIILIIQFSLGVERQNMTTKTIYSSNKSNSITLVNYTNFEFPNSEISYFYILQNYNPIVKKKIQLRDFTSPIKYQYKWTSPSEFILYYNGYNINENGEDVTTKSILINF